MINTNRILHYIGLRLDQAIYQNDRQGQLRWLKEANFIGQKVRADGPRIGSNHIFEIHTCGTTGRFHAKAFHVGNENIANDEVYGENVIDDQGSCPWTMDGTVTQLDSRILEIPSILGGGVIDSPLCDYGILAQTAALAQAAQDTGVLPV